jgi:hypothetical protein
MRNTLKFIVALILAAVSVPVFAQVATSPYSAPEYYASSFNLWSINSQSPNTYTFPGRTICNSAGQNQNFFVFSTTAPILIVDSNSANSEVVTPSSVINTAGSCGVAIAPANNHNSFQLRSGTGGLQEAINTLKGQSAWPVVIDLDRNWYAIANNIPGTSAATIIGATVGDGTVLLKDITTSPATFYKWTGTAYADASPANTWLNTAPALAAGAAAGTSPTVANKAGSTQLVGIANVTTGTATTTGTLFTETFPSSGANGGFGYAGSCVVTSTGATPFTTFTVATSGTTTRILTVTVTATPAVSTAYSFAYNCK